NSSAATPTWRGRFAARSRRFERTCGPDATRRPRRATPPPRKQPLPRKILAPREPPRGDARAFPPRAQERRVDRLRPHDGRAPRGTPLADAPRPPREPQARRERLREPASIRPPRGLRPLPAERITRLAPLPRGRVRLALHAVPAGHLSSRVRDARRARADRGPVGGGCTAGTFRRRAHRRPQAARDGRAGHDLPGPEGRPAGGPRDADGARPRSPGARRGLSHGAGAGWAGALLSKRIPDRLGAGAGPRHRRRAPRGKAGRAGGAP